MKLIPRQIPPVFNARVENHASTIRLANNGQFAIDLFPRVLERRLFGWIHIVCTVGSASVQLVDGSEPPFPFAGQLVEATSILAVAVYPMLNTRQAVTVRITAGSSGFQGELHLEMGHFGQQQADSAAELSVPND